MLGYQDLLVLKFWVPEHGCPENAEQFEYLHVHAPHQNLKKGALYPEAMLVSEDGDTRMGLLHAHKMATKLQ